MNKLVLSIIFAATTLWLAAQSFNCLGVDFTRINKENAVTDTTSGKIYFQMPGKMYIQIYYPVNQHLTYDKDKFFIYYPETKEAFAIYSSNPTAIPFFTSFISVVKEDFGLSDLGFIMASHIVKGDTLIAEWTPPEALKPVLSKVRITYDKQKLISSQTFDTKAQLIISTNYADHYEFKGYYFPLTVTTHNYSGTIDNIEKVQYSNPQFELDFPAITKHFEIPEQIPIKEIHM
jgi:outer membrane lipoprotein-sorting protein